jgi:hypothetical protein
MAGQGRKTFVAGEVLTAQDVNDYLMDQSIMNFATTAARSSAIPTPTEGMFAITKDDDELDYYNGSAWVSALPVGAWKAYTPTLSGLTIGNGVLDFKYSQIGKTVHVKGKITLGSTSSVTTTVDIGTPVASTGYSTGYLLGNFSAYNNSSVFTGQMINVANPNAFRATVNDSSAAITRAADLSAAVPFTWANTHTMFVTYTYEAA